MILIKLFFGFILMIILMAFVFGLVAFVYGKSKLDEIREKMGQAQDRFTNGKPVAPHDDAVEIQAVQCPHCEAYVPSEKTCQSCGKAL